MVNEEAAVYALPWKPEELTELQPLQLSLYEIGLVLQGEMILRRVPGTDYKLPLTVRLPGDDDDDA